MKKIFLILLSVFIVSMLTACGGGGDSTTNNTTNPPVDPGNPPIPPVVTAPDILGNYTLTATKITYASGVTVTEKDISVNGTMDVYKDTLVETIRIGITTFSSDVHYTLDWNAEQTGGSIHITTGDGVIHSITFTYDKDTKTLKTYSGVITANGVSYEEWDTWTPVTATKAAKLQASLKATITILDDFIFIGNHLENGGK